MRAYVGLGANVGDAQGNIELAVKALAALPTVRLRKVSPLYKTKPVGLLEQPDFLNAVALVDISIDGDAEVAALRLLGELKQIERDLGRQERERWGPREIDLDLLVFGAHRIDAPSLEVPHPEMRNRLFVLAPLSDLAPGLRPPGWGETVQTAISRIPAEELASLVELVPPQPG